MQLIKVISGGQTGADQAGWRAAVKAGIPTGGWMPKGWKTEDGRHAEFSFLFDAEEHESPEYPPRTEANVRGSDGTILFGEPKSQGGVLARRLVEKWRKSYFEAIMVEPFKPGDIADVVQWIERGRIRVLNVAGNRESKAPGIGVWVEAYLAEVFAELKRSDDLAAIRQLHAERDEYAGEGY